MIQKSEIEAARARHDMRVGALARANWANDRTQLIKASHRLMEREIAAIKRKAANDNEERLSRCAGTVTDENPLTGKEKTNAK